MGKHLTRFMIMVLTALSLLAPATTPARASSPSAVADLHARILYFQSSGRDTDRRLAQQALSQLAAADARRWAVFVANWRSINAGFRPSAVVPNSLPTKGHVFVVLGSALLDDGRLSQTLTHRLKTTLTALRKYPNSSVLVTGGKPKKGVTEAAAMRTWLIAQGIAAGRIITETKATSTVGNARNSIAILARRPQFTSYTLISDASHLRRASVLFYAATTRKNAEKGWSIRALGTIGYADETVTLTPSVSEAAWIASDVATVFGLSYRYERLVDSPPKKAKLVSVTVSAPGRTIFGVGERPNLAKAVVTARYDTSSFGLRASDATYYGFSSAEVGHTTLKVRYTEAGVAKFAGVKLKVVKARSVLQLQLSTTKPRRNQTDLIVSARVLTTASKAKGLLVFRLNGRPVRTKPIATDGGWVSFRYPKLTTAGTQKIVVNYSGEKRIEAARRTTTVTVRH